MPKLYSLLLIIILASFLTGCAAAANPQVEEITVKDGSRAPAGLTDSSTDSAYTEVVSHNPPDSCPITRAPDVAFIPPEPYPSAPPERYENQFWFGTAELWTMLGTDGTWYALPQSNNGYGQKVFWWSQSFDSKVDPFPAFSVTVEQLDTHAPSAPNVVAQEATNASADFGTAMLTGVQIPSLGCWKVTGQYNDSELSFVVWVAP